MASIPTEYQTPHGLSSDVRELVFEKSSVTLGRFLEAHEDATIEITRRKWLSWTMDPIFPWFEDNGIDLNDFEGEWMRKLTPDDE